METILEKREGARLACQGRLTMLESWGLMSVDNWPDGWGRTDGEREGLRLLQAAAYGWHPDPVGLLRRING